MMISALPGELLHCRNVLSFVNCRVVKPWNRGSLAKVSSSGTTAARLDTLLNLLAAYFLCYLYLRGRGFGAAVRIAASHLGQE